MKKKRYLFDKLIESLESNHISYAIVGNTDSYPDNIGSDVDLMVPWSQVAAFHRMIWNMQDTSTKVVQMLQHEIVGFFYVLMKFDEAGLEFLQPDVCTDYYIHGHLMLEAEYLLQNTRIAPQGRFWILSSEKEFIYYLVKRIVDKEYISPLQFNHLSKVFNENRNGALAECKRFWTDSQIEVIKKSFVEENYELLISQIPLLTHICPSKKLAIIDRCKNVVLKCRRIARPTGLTIAVCSNKERITSEIIDNMKEEINPAFRKIYEYKFYNFKLFFYFEYLIKFLPKKIKSTLIIYRCQNIEDIGYLYPTPDLIFLFDTRSTSSFSNKLNCFKLEFKTPQINSLELCGSIGDFLHKRTTKRYRK